MGVNDALQFNILNKIDYDALKIKSKSKNVNEENMVNRFIVNTNTATEFEIKTGSNAISCGTLTVVLHSLCKFPLQAWSDRLNACGPSKMVDATRSVILRIRFQKFSK